MMAGRIEDYALIGDCETAALVGRDGSIDWLCWPRFDSGAVFASLLGKPDNGRWIVCPADPAARVTRRYRHNTLVLETTFETREGAATVIDFMPLRFQGRRPEDTSHLVRIVRGQRGSVAMTIEFMLRFDYGSIVPWIKRADTDTLVAVAGPDMVVLRSSVPLRAEGYRHLGNFEVSAGQDLVFSLDYGPSYCDPPDGIDALAALDTTATAWQEWSREACDFGPYSEAATRSLITLKALTYRPTGGMVAAPTTSLPESFGGPRNWDYRFCWLRDATFTLLALMTAGYYHEAAAWRDWLRRAVAGNPAQVQIMYGLAGERRVDEHILHWLEGYGGSQPVRIGNAAAGQLQLDIFGEVLDALYLASTSGLAKGASDWDLLCALVAHLETIWHLPDSGIWEVRGVPRQFTYSKVMAWVAFDRAIKFIERWKLEGPLARWREVRDRIHREVCRDGFNPERGTFVQSYGSDELDASTLLIPLVGFLPATDPRVKSTIAAIRRELMEDDLVLRYRPERTDDGLHTPEGAFLACSFWLVDNLVLLGELEEATRIFDRLLSLRNDVGLLAEEYDWRVQRQAGNFPQAFSHVALVNSAGNIFRASIREKPAAKRSGVKAGQETAAP
jgi:GH15 family glucan-1,4-alpha-glucosidase